jgi:hypothetical protein
MRGMMGVEMSKEIMLASETTQQVSYLNRRECQCGS